MSEAPILEVRDLAKSYGARIGCADITFDLWPGEVLAVVGESGELIGFFSFAQEGPGVVAIGLGLRPDHTGKGLGQAFVLAGLEFAKGKFHPTQFRLSVAAFNRRAIRLYERLGFRQDGLFENETNGGRYRFLRMARDA